MFLTNGMKATLIKHNRKQTGVWDDEYTETTNITLCPYNQDIRVAFGVYTIPEAEGFYIVKNKYYSIKKIIAPVIALAIIIVLAQKVLVFVHAKKAVSACG